MLSKFPWYCVWDRRGVELKGFGSEETVLNLLLVKMNIRESSDVPVYISAFEASI